MILVENNAIDRITNLRHFWQNNRFQLGIPLIDMQHLWLLHIIADLESSISESQNANKENLRESLVAVIDYISEHFSLEEDILRKFQYPNYKEHVLHHRKFVESLLEKEDLASTNELTALGLLSKLQKWLFNHILIEDKMYADFFEKQNQEIKEYCQQIVGSRKYNITKLQGELYKQICNPRQTDIEEVINDNLVQEIGKIWSTHNLSIQIPVIDLQHIWLLKMVIQLDKAVKTLTTTKKIEIFHQIIDEAIEYAMNHFTLEEKIMKEFRFPETLHHYFQHESFVNFVNQRKKENESGDHLAAFHLVQDLKTWLLSHIAYEDKKLSLFLRGRIKEVNTFAGKLFRETEIQITVEQRSLYKKVLKNSRNNA